MSSIFVASKSLYEEWAFHVDKPSLVNAIKNSDTFVYSVKAEPGVYNLARHVPVVFFKIGDITDPLIREAFGLKWLSSSIREFKTWDLGDSDHSDKFISDMVANIMPRKSLGAFDEKLWQLRNEELQQLREKYRGIYDGNSSRNISFVSISDAVYGIFTGEARSYNPSYTLPVGQLGLRRLNSLAMKEKLFPIIYNRLKYVFTDKFISSSSQRVSMEEHFFSVYGGCDEFRCLVDDLRDDYVDCFDKQKALKSEIAALEREMSQMRSKATMRVKRYADGKGVDFLCEQGYDRNQSERFVAIVANSFFPSDLLSTLLMVKNPEKTMKF
ncbi:hypothetical protein [Photobacterium kishitanii]|uniref:Uncharacterized protein n=1 Tax=Photobacterium kishitanii TaxID=318456 RepID=A0A2T3KMD9_9GAMM|nr:hypothetical protein [Photobacterium kishitanii]PSV00942.1 hypothetical protein C9J27_02650 [Photobacterium kishitanii]